VVDGYRGLWCGLAASVADVAPDFLGGRRRGAGNQGEHAGVAAQRFGGLEHIELRKAFPMGDHVVANSLEGAGLFKLDVEAFDFFRDAPGFTRQGGAVRSPIRGGRGCHWRECSTPRKVLCGLKNEAP